MYSFLTFVVGLACFVYGLFGLVVLWMALVFVCLPIKPEEAEEILSGDKMLKTFVLKALLFFGGFMAVGVYFIFKA